MRGNILNWRIAWLWWIIVCVRMAVAAPLRLAVQNTGPPVEWEGAELFLNTRQLPLVMVDVKFPPGGEGVPVMPPSHIPVLLQLELSSGGGNVDDHHLDRFGSWLTTFTNISHLSLKGWERIEDFNHLAYTIKRIVSLARGIRPELRIALACCGGPLEPDLASLLRTVAASPDTAPYFDCFFLDEPVDDTIRETILRQAPHICFWESVHIPEDRSGMSVEPCRIISRILEHNPLENPDTSLLVISARQPDLLYSPLRRLSSYLLSDLYSDGSSIDIIDSRGTPTSYPLLFRTADHSPVFFPGDGSKEKAMIQLEKGVYGRAEVENLISGERAVFKVLRHSTALKLNLNGDCFAVRLFLRKTRIAGSRHDIQVTGQYHLTAREIIARVRAWKARQQSLLKTFTATMTTSMRLRIANLKETFDLTIRGPMFSRRNQPYDWVWKEFFINGVEWKGKKVPRIPLLQPEKVNTLPLDIGLTEEYEYTSAGLTTMEGRQAYIIDFHPRKEVNTASLYKGRIWIDAETFAVLREHLIQLHLKGEVLSNVETREFQPLDERPEIRLPVEVTGHQVFSTAGRITNIERRVSLTEVEINPENFDELREAAYRSDFHMVKDTSKGLRYLVKDEKSGNRSVEWKTRKSQFFGVVGGFYDSSFDYPIPMLGFNYMNFDLGGKGRQMNILFGGAMLTANYSDPAFLGTRIDLGANLVAVAFPFSNRVYRHGEELEDERLKRWPFRFQINTGIPLGAYLKFSSFFIMEYNKFSLAKTTGDDFNLPATTFSLGWRSKLAVNFKGFKLSLWGELAQRSRWSFWGMTGNERYDPEQRSYLRWRVVLSKDFFMSRFRRVHLTAAYFDGQRLDRFSAYKFGFFNELSLHGYMSGVVQASRAFMINLSYGIGLGNAFRLEASYDSIWVTSPYNTYRNTYFSGAALSGNMNIPGLKGILRFEVGMPVVSNGIRGVILYFIFLKMF